MHFYEVPIYRLEIGAEEAFIAASTSERALELVAMGHRCAVELRTGEIQQMPIPSPSSRATVRVSTEMPLLTRC